MAGERREEPVRGESLMWLAWEAGCAAIGVWGAL